MTIILLVKQGIVKKNVACLRVFEEVELSVWSQVTESIILLLIQLLSMTVALKVVRIKETG